MEDYNTAGWNKPFELRTLDSAPDMVTVRMNNDERRMLNDLKRIFQCDRDSTIIKQCLKAMHGNVVHNPSTRSFFQWLSNGRRVRPGPKSK